MGRKPLSVIVFLMLLLVTTLTSGLDLAPLATSAVSSTSPPAVEWSQTYGSGGTDRASSVQQTSDGGYMVFGGRFTDYWLIKTNSSGGMEWNNIYNTGYFVNYGAAQQTSDDGYIMVGCGSTDKGSSTYAWLVKTNSGGGMQWSKNYSSGISDYNGAYSIQQTRDGGYIIVGWTGTSATKSDVWLLKINSAGGMQWSKTYGGANHDYAHSVQQTSDGGYVFAGYIYTDADLPADRKADFWFVKTNAAGAVEWSQTYENGIARSIKQTNDGGYIVAGYTSPNDSVLAEDAWVIKTNSTGSLQWSKIIGGTSQDEFHSVSLTSGGGYILGGVNVGIVKMNSTGGIEWNQTYSGTAYSVVQTDDGGYIAAGIAPSPSIQWDKDIWLMKLEGYDADGDGLLDDWEQDGIDYNNDGITDLDLPALGADWQHKDIFVEVDYMPGHYPDPDAMTDVKASFADAPVENPDGITGINLHIDVDESVPHKDQFRPMSYDVNDFDTVKSSYFGTPAQRSNVNSPNILDAKKLAYRYCLFIHDYLNWNGTQWVKTTSGGMAECPGNDFFVSLGGWSTDPGTRDEQAATFMHELGHNLNLCHGGGDDINYKPNYLSIMNYAFQIGAWYVSWRPLDYSQRELPALQEGGLNEPSGIQGSGFWLYTIWNNSQQIYKKGLTFGPLDWNGDGNFSYLIQANINNFPGWDYASDPMELLEGYDDWANLKFSFRDTLGYADGVHPQMADPEITWETVQAIRESVLAMHDVAIFNLTSWSTIWSQGNALSVNLTLVNFGVSDENAYVAVYANSTMIASSSIVAKANNLTKITLPYTGQALNPGAYVLKATVNQVAGETYTADNTVTGETITVTDVIPEFPPLTLLVALIVLTLAVSLAFRRRNK